MFAAAHSLNWYFGWSLILAGFVVGAEIGLLFHREDFLGGYTSFRRRIIRLGHVALVALGMLNILFAISVAPSSLARIASALLITGGVAMPAVCFLTGWRQPFRHLFFIPVVSLVSAVVLVLIGGLP